MYDVPEHLAELARVRAWVRIVCGRCGFEEDWAPDALERHLAETGGSRVWSEVVRHLHCRSFGCGSTDLSAVVIPSNGRQANLPRRIGRLDAHLLGAALGVIEVAVRRSDGQAVAGLELRLALLVVHRYARDRDCVRRFWSVASRSDRSVDDGLIEPLRLIRQALVAAGWLAPSVLLDPVKTWPWESPAPPGWRRPAA